MKKKFLPSFQPARLILGTSRTYINVYFTTKKGTRKQIKPTFNLGRILNKREREKRGNILVDKINWWLEQGYYFEDFDETKVEMNYHEINKANKKELLLDTNIIEALEKARDIKIAKTKKASVRNTYKSKTRILINWLRQEKIDRIKASEFTRADAMNYLLYYRNDRKTKNNKPIGNTTYNAIITHQSALWGELLTLGFITENPFSKLKRLQEEDKVRRAFESHESEIVLDYLYKNDRLLYYAVVIIYLTGIRPVELIGLKFRDICLMQGVIRITGENSKLNTARYATIPNDYLEVFTESFWLKYPPEYYIFGKGLIPSATTKAGKESLKTKHKLVLDKLHRKGLILKREGLQFYSWKDTGASDIIDNLGIEVAKKQLGHKKFKTTLRYKKKDPLNYKMLKFKREVI